MLVVVLADGKTRHPRRRVAGFEAVADGVALVVVGVDAAVGVGISRVVVTKRGGRGGGEGGEIKGGGE